MRLILQSLLLQQGLPAKMKTWFAAAQFAVGPFMHKLKINRDLLYLSHCIDGAGKHLYAMLIADSQT